MVLCSAKKADGTPCRNHAIKGGTVCYQAHGGRAGQVRRAAQKRLASQEASAIVAAYEHEPLESPDLALLTVASEFMALKDELGRRSAELSEITTRDRHQAEQISAILGSYQAALVQLADVLVKINRLGLENRRTLVAESDYRALVKAVQTGTYAAGPRCDPPLSHEQMQTVLGTISEHLTAAYGQ